MEQIRKFLCTRRGILYTIISGLGYGSLGIFSNLTPSIHAFESCTVRALFLVLLSLVVIIASRYKPVFSKKEFFWVMVNASLATAVQISLFLAYALAPAGDVNVIVYSSPLFSGILARIFLKETLACYDTVLSLISTVGVFLISKPAFVFGEKHSEEADDHFKGTLWSIGALFFYSMLPVVSRKLRRDSTNASILTLTFGIFASLASSILNSFAGSWTIPVDVKETGFLIGVCVSGFVGIQFLFLALKTQKAVFVALGVTVSTTLSTYVLQFLVLHVYPDVISGTGIMLICGATIVALVIKWRESEETDKESNIPDTKEKDAATQTELAFDNPAVKDCHI